MSLHFLETGREEVCRFWDTGILMGLCVLLILLVALVGAVLVLRECYARYCYPAGRLGSYVSIKFERSGTRGSGRVSCGRLEGFTGGPFGG